MSQKEQAAQNRSRLTLDLSTRMTAALNNYAEKHGVTKAEALRSAVELLMVADSAVDEGFKVGAWNTDGGQRLEREFVRFAG
ncbi:MAG: hypothetical protein J7521_20795 [Caulobacter sp.]|nr:hypothetical protein [Caulobacter sp.]